MVFYDRLWSLLCCKKQKMSVTVVGGQPLPFLWCSTSVLFVQQEVWKNQRGGSAARYVSFSELTVLSVCGYTPLHTPAANFSFLTNTTALFVSRKVFPFSRAAVAPGVVTCEEKLQLGRNV